MEDAERRFGSERARGVAFGFESAATTRRRLGEGRLTGPRRKLRFGDDEDGFEGVDGGERARVFGLGAEGGVGAEGFVWLLATVDWWRGAWNQ